MRVFPSAQNHLNHLRLDLFQGGVEEREVSMGDHPGGGGGGKVLYEFLGGDMPLGP